MIDKSDQSTGLQHPKLTLRQLSIFVAMVRTGTTHAAAAQISRSQSAASAALAELEEALGASLFDRVGRRLVLNANGRALLAPAQAMLEQAGDIQSLFKSERGAHIRVAASFTIGEYLLPPRIAAWSQAWPKSLIQMRVGNTKEVIESVAELGVDLGFVEGPQTHAEVVIHPWLEDELVIVAAPGHPLTERVVARRQLDEAHWVLREADSGTRKVADEWLLNNLRQVNVAMELGSTEAIKRVVACGDGIAFLSGHAAEQSLKDGRLAIVRTDLPKARRRLGVVVHRRKQQGQAVLDFIRHCGAQIAG
ncbi:LysR family transcriptional regulator [Ottowia sp. VDI28]|uniref:LysR family transcriptional regulator n=1 Tax=Ottowia sp. VDI28 TaxID=3133968 RepID=UPI003C2ED9C8